MNSVLHHKSLNLVTDSYTYKIGMNEVAGLETSITKCLEPLKQALTKKVCEDITFESAEYLRRDGFIPHGHNCGGLQFNNTIPKFMACEFCKLEFGEVTDDDLADCKTDEEREELEQSYSDEGYLDCHLSIWFKFEGFNDDGEMMFYLVASAGNNDAPYFRNIPTIFEVEFKCNTLKQLENLGTKKVNAMIKKIF